MFERTLFWLGALFLLGAIDWLGTEASPATNGRRTRSAGAALSRDWPVR